MGQPVIRFQCRCGKRLAAPPAAAGKKSRCPQCQEIVVVPGAQSAEPVTASPSSSPKSPKGPAAAKAQPVAAAVQKRLGKPPATKPAAKPSSPKPVAPAEPAGEHANVPAQSSADNEPVAPLQRPRSRRYSILKPELLSLMIELDGAGQPIPGDILDISRGGMKLAITTPIAGQPAFRATISCSSLELQVDLEAQAHWIRPLQESAWLIGCSVNPPLPEDFLTVLLDEGVLERRAFPRYPVNADVVIEWELGKAGAEGQLRDLSKEGFCVFLAEKGKLGTRALVRLVEHGAASQVMAQMQWQAKTADGYLIGCEFRDDQAYYKWQSLLDTGQTLEVPRTRRRRGMTIKRLVALILFLCMVIAGSAAAWKFIPREQWQQWLALIGIKM